MRHSSQENAERTWHKKMVFGETSLFYNLIDVYILLMKDFFYDGHTDQNLSIFFIGCGYSVFFVGVANYFLLDIYFSAARG